MLFTSATFLFLFLPIVLGIYFVIGRRARNAFLLVASLFFYAWGEGTFVLVMVASIAANYFFGRALGGARHGKRMLGAAVAFNLGLLVSFKYANFLGDNLNVVLAALGASALVLPAVHLPLGISFFTFHALSYLVDVYRTKVKALRNPIDFGLYIALFPQLIAGPIVRYHDIAAQIASRVVDPARFAVGVRRFILGLGKKMLIANTVAAPADAIFAIPSAELTTSLAWLGAVLYTLQIYCDFSAYSDMAIGLAKMLGFDLLENFDYPYVSRSITEFWRRWHISLSNWFRDYLYIPLGGNRRRPVVVYRNLVTVFLLCGLWHGARWTFVGWGLFHGVFLVAERIGLGRLLARAPAAVSHAYAILAVMAGWVFFRAADFSQALAFLGAMAGFGRGSGVRYHAGLLAGIDVVLAAIAGTLVATPVVPVLARCWRQWVAGRDADTTALVLRSASVVAEVGVLVLVSLGAAAMVAANTYNPFIYFRF
jgi:alginate O-acetyltransferase complex protein AlgI